MKALEEVALGAEKSRRAAWAQVYQLRERVEELEFELAKYRQIIDGEAWTTVTVRCPHPDCGGVVVAPNVEPVADWVKDEWTSGHLHALGKNADVRHQEQP